MVDFLEKIDQPFEKIPESNFMNVLLNLYAEHKQKIDRMAQRALICSSPMKVEISLEKVKPAVRKKEPSGKN